MVAGGQYIIHCLWKKTLTDKLALDLKPMCVGLVVHIGV
jgi:hypothetical protein